MERRRQFYSVLAGGALIIALCTLARAQYGGGSGTAEEPYLIYTPEQMNAIGADPNDWDKHFQLRADLDLSQYTGSEFNLIGPEVPIGRIRRTPTPVDVRAETTPTSFTGVFDGNGHAIANFSYTAAADHKYVALFRCIDDPNAEVRNLGLVDPAVDAGSGNDVGALVGHIEQGRITSCYVAGGTVAGNYQVGGLVGAIGYGTRTEGMRSPVTDCHCTCDVAGRSYVGGLVGNSDGAIANSSTAGVVTGHDHVGGLAGYAWTLTGCYADGIVLATDQFGRFADSRYVGGLAGSADLITNCYAQGIVIGGEYVGGLAGWGNSAANCYATALVRGTSYTGGLIAPEQHNGDDEDDVVASFWDVETSRQVSSAGGLGRSTAEMQTLVTFLPWGQGDNAGIWTIDDGNDYPRLAWERRPGTPIAPEGPSGWFAGSGTPDDPFLIYTAGQLDLIGQLPDQWDKHYRLMADIDLAGYGGSEFHLIGSREAPFLGVFDGNGHTISNFTYASDEDRYVGLFAYVQLDPCLERRYCDPAESAVITNLGLVNPDVNGGESRMGGAMVGYLSSGAVTNCYVEGGVVSTDESSQSPVGGLVGYCGDSATIATCYASAVVIGGTDVGGLVGNSREATIKDCYATGAVIGDLFVGGLIGYSYSGGVVENCYATGFVVGNDSGGLMGAGSREAVRSFWDVETSGQETSAAGVGLTTAEMWDIDTYLAAGWDFVGEAENGAEEIWWIDEAVGYPRLWWEAADAEF